MDFKRIYISSKIYVILLIVAVGLLLFTTSMAYKQMMLTQKSAEIMVHTLHVYNAIGDLTTHCTKAESEEFRKDLLESKSFNNVFESYKAEGRAIIDTLRVLTEDSSLQKLRLILLSDLLDKLNVELVSFDVVNQQKSEKALQALELQKIEIGNTLSDIRNIKDRMLADEKRFMNNRKANYILHKSLTPTLLLGMAFFALVVFVTSFFRIYFTNLKIEKSEAFLKSVLANTDNIVNYYEPIFNKDSEITDFKLLYANDCNYGYMGLKLDEILGKTILGIYPLHRSYEELKELIQSYNEQGKVIFDRQIIIGNKKMWFHSIATPLSDGLLVTSRNSTPEEEAKEIELTLKKRLENQNLKLLDNRAFLTNIFKSISDIVMHFKSVRNENDKIIDFEILFTNERISSITRDTAEEIKNKKISDIYPTLFKSNVFEYLVHAIENDKPIEYEVPFTIGGKKYWFHATAIKLGDGVTVTIRDITDEKEKADKIIQLNEELVIQNSILTDAEHIAKTGSFIWYLDNGTAEISDNFYYMLGYAPKEFEITYERYRKFVHPDDLDEFDKNEQKAIKKSHAEETTYRVITKQGVIKHFKTNGQFTLKKGNRVMIGVVQDVTQAIEAEERLIKSNLALMNSNAELESFSRIASHDLQEPLRKIQLFVLRIEDLDGKNLSGKSKEYFWKVANAATRMQSLIQNLLAYSRIDSSKKDFEKVDLNQVLNKVKDDLVTAINDSNAEVVSDKLPNIKGVVFQIEQLFTNIISNALKYRKMSEPTKIQIKYEKVNAKDVPSFSETSKKYYHKISFLDNGIGFDSQHAEKIFEVFQRLHQKTEYSGTGIGLAICKKIVENHNGYILAKGSTGIGAEFIVYLPV